MTKHRLLHKQWDLHWDLNWNFKWIRYIFINRRKLIKVWMKLIMRNMIICLVPVGVFCISVLSISNSLSIHFMRYFLLHWHFYYFLYDLLRPFNKLLDIFGNLYLNYLLNGNMFNYQYRFLSYFLYSFSG